MITPKEAMQGTLQTTSCARSSVGRASGLLRVRLNVTVLTPHQDPINQRVPSSNLGGRTKKFYGPVAQLDRANN